jgi:hypothetical protein
MHMDQEARHDYHTQHSISPCNGSLRHYNNLVHSKLHYCFLRQNVPLYHVTFYIIWTHGKVIGILTDYELLIPVM